MKIENVAVISLEDYAEYQELKRKNVKHKIDGCLMEDCDGVNYGLPGNIEDCHSYELIIKRYGQRDVFKAKYNDTNKDIILFGTWVD